jgi:hypothetical protein
MRVCYSWQMALNAGLRVPFGNTVLGGNTGKCKRYQCHENVHKVLRLQAEFTVDIALVFVRSTRKETREHLAQ